MGKQYAWADIMRIIILLITFGFLNCDYLRCNSLKKKLIKWILMRCWIGFFFFTSFYFSSLQKYQTSFSAKMTLCILSNVLPDIPKLTDIINIHSPPLSLFSHACCPDAFTNWPFIYVGKS